MYKSLKKGIKRQKNSITRFILCLLNKSFHLLTVLLKLIAQYS